MRNIRRTTAFTSVYAFVMVLAGCESEFGYHTLSELPETPPSTVHRDHADGSHGGHHHHAAGPHGGHIIELGHGDYHAELVHDEMGRTVSVYILDERAEAVRPIACEALLINVKHQDRSEQFRLAAADEFSQQPGGASRFCSDDEHLQQDLHARDVKARLMVKIADKSYTVDLDHDHHHHEPN